MIHEFMFIRKDFLELILCELRFLRKNLLSRQEGEQNMPKSPNIHRIASSLIQGFWAPIIHSLGWKSLLHLLFLILNPAVLEINQNQLDTTCEVDF